MLLGWIRSRIVSHTVLILPILLVFNPDAHELTAVAISDILLFLLTCCRDRLVGLVVKASASRAEGPGFESRLRWDFFGVESYQ